MNVFKEFVVELLFPLQCHDCGIDAAYILCNSCASRLIDAQCVRCQNHLESGFCRQCLSEMNASGFRAIAPYSLIGQWIFDNKLDLGSNAQIMNTKLFNLLCEELVRGINKPFSVELVPSQDRENWVVKTLPNSIKKRIGVTCLGRATGQIAQKYLNRKERISQRMRLFEERTTSSITTDAVLLIDDVMSTGSSLDSCISTLLGLGYSEVYVLVFAYQKMLSEESYGP